MVIASAARCGPFAWAADKAISEATGQAAMGQTGEEADECMVIRVPRYLR
jgi:hypothetical protein